MIVGSYFDGDDDTGLAWKQHDVYGQALQIMVSTCNRYAAFAKGVLDDISKTLLRDINHHEWGNIYRCDHRTLQDAHDLLAAAWRFRHDFRQGALPFGDIEPPKAVELLWLDWLHNEVSNWIDRPYLVRSVQAILVKQNKFTGYLAESKLSVDIMHCFTDVPWKMDRYNAHTKDLADLITPRTTSSF